MRLLDLNRSLGTTIVYAGTDLDHIQIAQVTGITQAGPGSLTFLASSQYQSLAAQSQAAALITRDVVPEFKGPQLLHKDPHFAYAKAAQLFHRIDHGTPGVSPQAFVEASARLGRDVTVHPGAYIGARAVLGDRVVVYPGVYIGADVTIGDDTVLYPHVVIYYACVIGRRCILHAGSVIGADGFGYAVSSGEICKIPQMGIVRLGDDVEVGALSSIDRATNGETLIKNSCKFDNHVQIGHNVEVGENCMFSAQSGVAGSTKVGQWVLMGGQSGIADHLTVTDRVRIAAKTAVVTPLTEGGTYVGFPAVPQKEWGRNLVYVKRLKDYEKRLRDLETRLASIQAKEEGLT